MSGTLSQKDIAAYHGKGIKAWVGNFQLRGVQSLDTTEERSEDRIAELGFEATKVVLGPAEYSCSVEILVRDLYNLAKLSGINPATAKRIALTEFAKINMIQHFEDPDVKDQINFSKYVGGFKPRTSSTSMAADANASVSMDGGAELIAKVEGKCGVEQFAGDGTTTVYTLATGETVLSFPLVENPAGVIVAAADYTEDIATKKITFGTAPEANSAIRIVYSYS